MGDYSQGGAGSRFVGVFDLTTNPLCGMEIENTTLSGNYSQKLHLRTHHYANSEDRRLTIDEGGNVGIGTTNPYTPLHIRSAGTLGQVLKVSNTAANSSTWIELECLAGSSSAQQWGLNSAEGGQFRIYKRTGIGAGTWALNIDGDGKVGIGDTTPSYKLDVAGDVNFTGNLYQNGSLFSSGGGGGGGSSVWSESGGSVSRTSGFARVGLTFMSYNTTNLSGAYCGLSANAHGSMALWNNGHIRDSGSIHANNTHNTMKGAGLIIPGNNQGNQNSILFYTQPADSVTAGNVSTGNLRMIIGANGNVGIGTTNPLAYLHIKGAHPANTNLSDANDFYMLIGGTEYATNSYRLIGFGYINSSTKCPQHILVIKLFLHLEIPMVI